MSPWNLSCLARLAVLLLVCCAPSVGCAGCGLFPAPEVVSTDYDTSCEENADCVPITEGSVCAVCGCPGAAINVSEETQFNEDVERATRRCGSSMEFAACGPCQETAPRCVSGSCEVHPVVSRNVTGLDTSCVSADDCAAVSIGRACGSCGCSKAAVSMQGLEEYRARYADIECGVVEVQDCAACPPDELACDDGVCVVQSSF